MLFSVDLFFNARRWGCHMDYMPWNSSLDLLQLVLVLQSDDSHGSKSNQFLIKSGFSKVESETGKQMQKIRKKWKWNKLLTFKTLNGNLNDPMSLQIFVKCLTGFLSYFDGAMKKSQCEEYWMEKFQLHQIPLRQPVRANLIVLQKTFSWPLGLRWAALCFK